MLRPRTPERVTTRWRKRRCTRRSPSTRSRKWEQATLALLLRKIARTEGDGWEFSFLQLFYFFMILAFEAIVTKLGRWTIQLLLQLSRFICRERTGLLRLRGDTARNQNCQDQKYKQQISHG